MLEKWQNLNSFLARFSSRGYAPWLGLAIWQIREGLEEPPANDDYDDPLAACRIWVATEWITQCGCLIYKEMDSKYEPDQAPDSSENSGSLCRDIPSLDTKRWEFWHSRLVQIEGKTSDPSKMREAIDAMKEVEQNKV